MMEPFRYSLPNGGVVSGIRNIPPPSKSTPQFRPLIIALHGGMYECHYFDADSRHTASISSNTYEVPFVSINRPCYGESSSLLPIPEESDFVRETAVWLHDYILPTLWSKIGVENGCNCIVLLCHSLGTMYGVAAAALHGQDERPSYPLGGVIWSGLGDIWQPHMYENCISKPYDPLGEQSISSEVKDKIMFRPETVHGDVLKLTKKLDSPAPLAELESLPASWLPHWKEEWASHVKVPVMLAMMEHEPFFVVSEERLRACAVAFSSSPRVDSSFIWGAPHCMELSFWSQGWYARAFGFAIECSVHKGVISTENCS
ncbi:hypothetical protein NW761_012444 [Fusarium oxysporum]|nr:hypothetical protein NW758_010428 [Fusarium oxysporum]KAJ4059307.1 hypothetical protein NW763_006740 [Fusarium oxysporum]KAJ4062592.1 hypothetical protein NW753_004062 [Fusarium oxysporum]KAJ4076906.1 hypothetical protein NW761_012444 [Fusarium oxysporum]KAJ4089541.1 hypothetical protein NW769_013348 [Fusarium oxysporum]